MIVVRNVSKAYRGIGASYPALFNVSFTLSKGDNLVIVGKSGSGKSTLLNIITGIDQADSGEIVINGQHLEKMSETGLAKWRGKNVGIVFQFYQLLPSLCAIDNILFAMELVNVIPKANRITRAEKLLRDVGLLHKAKKYPNELSGGEKQRVAIARALANDPLLLVADEPTGNLDSATSKEIHELFLALNQSGKTIIRVTHENVSHLSYNRLFEMKDGVMHSPKN